MSNEQSLMHHWLAVGKISDAAMQEVLSTGGQVLQLHDEPAVVLVGIAYASPDNLTIMNTSEIEIATSADLHLVWVSGDRIINAAFCSIPETELVTYGEYEGRFVDVTTPDIPPYTGIDADPLTYVDELDDLDEHPF